MPSIFILKYRWRYCNSSYFCRFQMPGGIDDVWTIINCIFKYIFEEYFKIFKKYNKYTVSILQFVYYHM